VIAPGFYLKTAKSHRGLLLKNKWKRDVKRKRLDEKDE